MKKAEFWQLFTVALAVWTPLTGYWCWLQVSLGPPFLSSPLWNSFYLALIAAVLLSGWASEDANKRSASLALLVVYLIGRAAYGTAPEEAYLTPVTDLAAAAFCFWRKQYTVAAIFLVMVGHFFIAKGTGVSATEWQIRNNVLFVVQCATVLILWARPKKPRARMPNNLQYLSQQKANRTKSWDAIRSTKPAA